MGIGDLDFVGPVPSYVQRELEANGFKKSGRHWINDGAEIFLEFPGDALDPAERSIRYEAFGYDLVVVSLEDLLVDRLRARAYWKSGVDGGNAYQLYRVFRDEIDDERLTRRAREAGFDSASLRAAPLCMTFCGNDEFRPSTGRPVTGCRGDIHAAVAT